MISTVVQCNNNLCFVGSPVNLYRTSTSWTGWLRVVEMQKIQTTFQQYSNYTYSTWNENLHTVTGYISTTMTIAMMSKVPSTRIIFWMRDFLPSMVFLHVLPNISGRFICHPSGPGQDKMSPFQYVIPYRSCETSSSACETGDTVVPHQHYHLHLHDLVHLSSTHWSRESFGSEHHSCVGHHGVFIRRCRLFSQD